MILKKVKKGTRVDDLKYDEFIPKHPVRNSIYSKLYNLILKYSHAKDTKYNYTLSDIQKMTLNIEKSIFNYSLGHYKHTTIWTDSFKQSYCDVTARCYGNLNPEAYIKNTTLIHRLLSNEIQPEQIAYLTPEERFPERHKEINEYCKSLEPKYAKQIALEDRYDGAFQCEMEECKSWKTEYVEIQIKSCDEPSSKKILCFKCNHRWVIE
jgi:hypothetical protein